MGNDSNSAAVVLVVDDEDSVRFFVRRTLTREGHEILEAGNGQEGLDFFTSGRRIDVIITDGRMAVMDGPRFIRALKELLGDETPPIIVLSSEKPEFFAGLPIVELLEKPAHPSLIREAVRRALRVA